MSSPDQRVEDASFVARPSTLRAAALILALLLAPVVVRSYRIFRADWIVKVDETVVGYSRALEIDPSNAVYWWYRGRLRHYTVGVVDIPRAAEDYRHALALNPRLGQAWVDLADCYERLGEFGKAEDALDKALAVRTYSPVIRWQAGNYFLRRANLPRMYECFRVTSQYDIQKLGIAMQTAWKVDPDRARILERLIPDTLEANLRYMVFLVERNELDLALAAWQRSLRNEPAPESAYKVLVCFALIDRLLARERVDDALQVWDQALQKAGTGLRDTRAPGTNADAKRPRDTNLVWNGSFEREILQGGFDWRYPGSSSVQIRTDLNNTLEGLKCLRVSFGGGNLSFSGLSQIVPVPAPGAYLLEFYLRSEGLTTDQRPYCAIQGYPNAGGASLRTELFPASTQWQKISNTFVVKEDCRAVELTLRRDPSSKFDNEIKGSLWLDAITIRPIDDARTGAAPASSTGKRARR